MNDELKRLVEDSSPDLAPPFDSVVDRAHRRRRRRRAGAAVAGVAAAAVVSTGVLWGLGGGDEPSQVALDPTTTTASPAAIATDPPGPSEPPDWDGKGAPPIFLHTDVGQARIKPWTACYGNGCFDGAPRPPYVSAPAGTYAEFSFPFTDWDFEASFTRVDGGKDECARMITVPVEYRGDFVYRVPAAGLPGTYEVDLFGRGADGGDIAVTFQWTSTVAGAFPDPSGYVSAHYGSLELGIRDIGDIETAIAKVDLTYPDGTVEHFGPMRARPCNGSLWFTQREGGAGDDPTGPLDFRVTLTLDGTEYVGTARWPRDEIHGEEPFEPNSALTFTPELPAYTGG